MHFPVNYWDWDGAGGLNSSSWVTRANCATWWISWLLLAYVSSHGNDLVLSCEWLGFTSQICLREKILANNCIMWGLGNWGNPGSPGVLKLWVAWEVLRWLVKCRELVVEVSSAVGYATLPWFTRCEHPPKSHKNSKWHISAMQTESPCWGA